MKQHLIMGYLVAAGVAVLLSGCGYQNGWLYSDTVSTVYVEMFDTAGFRRGYEYELTDAICKTIESQTPYKIVSDRSRADSVLSGTMGIAVGVLASDPYTARPLEKETMVNVQFSWKNLKTGELLVNRQIVYASNHYSPQLGQTIDYSLARTANEAAQKVVEQMQIPW